MNNFTTSALTALSLLYSIEQSLYIVFNTSFFPLLDPFSNNETNGRMAPQAPIELLFSITTLLNLSLLEGYKMVITDAGAVNSPSLVWCYWICIAKLGFCVIGFEINPILVRLDAGFLAEHHILNAT